VNFLIFVTSEGVFVIKNVVDKQKLNSESMKDALYPDLTKSVYEHWIFMDGLDIVKTQGLMREMLKFLENKDCSNTLKVAILRAISEHILYALGYTQRAVLESNNSQEFKDKFVVESNQFKDVHQELIDNFNKEIEFYKKKKFNT
jgi:hypothetical protein